MIMNKLELWGGVISLTECYNLFEDAGVNLAFEESTLRWLPCDAIFR